MDLSELMYKIEKLIFLNRLFITAGIETQEPQAALYALEDEIKQLELVFFEVKEQFEQCF